MKIAIGTVQFGLPYGIGNKAGQTQRAEAKAILDHARAAGATILDTAVSYGEAETVLGEIGAADAGWMIITKLPGLPADLVPRDVGDWCRTTVEASLRRLRTDRVAGLLLHRPEDLRGPCGGALAEALLELRHRDRTEATGLSIYGPEDLDILLPDGPESAPVPLDIVQSPANVLDRRLETSGWAARLVGAGTRIHLRSVFLQGLLLMPPDAWPANLSDTVHDLASWRDWLAASKADPLPAALRFALSRDYAECAVLGMDSLDHLKQILTAADWAGPIPSDSLRSSNPRLLDPRKWMKP